MSGKACLRNPGLLFYVGITRNFEKSLLRLLRRSGSNPSRLRTTWLEKASPDPPEWPYHRPTLNLNSLDLVKDCGAVTSKKPSTGRHSYVIEAGGGEAKQPWKHHNGAAGCNGVNNALVCAGTFEPIKLCSGWLKTTNC